MPGPHDDPVDLLHRRGLRATPQRRAIVDAVRLAGGHVTAEEVYERVRVELPTLSLKTVYETLHSLVAAGEVSELALGGRPALFDTTIQAHHHVICLNCNRIEDIDFDVADLSVEQRRGFSVARTELIAWGLCPDCQDPVG